MKKLNFFLILTICLSYLTIHGSQEQSTWWNRITTFFSAIKTAQSDNKWKKFQKVTLAKASENILPPYPLIELHHDIAKLSDPLIVSQWTEENPAAPAILFAAIDLGKNPLVIYNNLETTGYVFLAFKLPSQVRVSHASLPETITLVKPDTAKSE